MKKARNIKGLACWLATLLLMTQGNIGTAFIAETEQQAAELTAPSFDPLTMAIVSDSSELRSALADPAKYAIYLANDITIAHNMPIANGAARTGGDTLCIYGYNPFAGDEPNSTRYILTESSTGSVVTGNRIYLNTNAGSLRNISFNDIDIYGTDFYGTVYITESAGYENITLRFENIRYTGPQPSYHAYGTVHYENAEIHLKQTLVNPAQEAAEAKNVILAGKVSIYREAAGVESIFWLRRAEGGLTVRAGATVDVTGIASSGTGNGFVYNMAASSNHFTVEENAVFRYEGDNCFVKNHRFAAMTVEANAEAEIIIKGNIVSPLLNAALSANELLVREGASLTVRAQDNNSTHFLANLQSAVFAKPKRIIFYNGRAAGGYALSLGVGSPDNYSINEVQAVHYWTFAPGWPLSQENGAADLAFFHVPAGEREAFSVTASGKGASINAAHSPQLPELNAQSFDHNGRGVIEIVGLAAPAAPTVTTRDASDITSVSARLNGGFDLNGQPFVRGIFAYGTTASYGLEAAWAAGSEMTGSASADIGGLAPNSLYHFRIGAATAGGTAYGENLSFLTHPAFESFSVETREDGSAAVTGTLTESLNGQRITGVRVYVRPGGGQDEDAKQITAHFDDTAFWCTLTGLRYGERYAVYAEAENASGKTLSDSLSLLYGNTQISVELPVQLLWAAFQSGNGEIVSPVYSISNRSDVPVRVSLSEFRISADTQGIRFVPDVPEADNEIQLHLKHMEGSGFDNSLIGIIPGILPNGGSLLGTLGGTVLNPGNANHDGQFCIGGIYKGAFAVTPKQLKIWFVFRFELVE